MVHKLLKESPRGLKTYELPTNEDLAKIKKGDDVKVVFGYPYNERMWVKVTKKLKLDDKGQEFEGELDNIPFTQGKIKLGDKIIFNAKHVIDIMR